MSATKNIAAWVKAQAVPEHYGLAPEDTDVEKLRNRIMELEKRLALEKRDYAQDSMHLMDRIHSLVAEREALLRERAEGAGRP